MRHGLAIGIASVLLLGIAGTAHAKLIGFNGTLSISLGGQPPVVATGSGNAVLNGSGGLGGHLTTLQILTNSVAITSAVVPITDPGATLGGETLVSVRGTAALGTGILRPISGGGTGLTRNVMPVTGVVRWCVLFTGCPISLLVVPLTVGGTAGVGIGGLITIGTFGQFKFSLQGQPWTVGTAVVTGITTDNGGLSTQSIVGFVHGPASATSSTAAIGGVIQLVTAMRLTSNIQALQNTFLTTLTIHLVPEPGTFVLFGSGVVALGIAGRRRLGKK